MTLLPEVEAALRDAVRRDQRARRYRASRRRFPLQVRRRRPVLAAGVGLVAAIVAIVTVVVANGTGGMSARSSSVAPGPSAQPLPAALEARFVSLRRPHAQNDSLPNDVLSALAHEHLNGIDASQSRLIFTAPANTIWLVPGPQETCMIMRRSLSGRSPVGAISTACSPNAVVEHSGIFSIGGTIIAGVLPDGSGSLTVTLMDGSTRSVAPNSSGAIAEQLTQPPSRLSYTDADGAAHTITVPAPSPPPGAP